MKELTRLIIWFMTWGLMLTAFSIVYQPQVFLSNDSLTYAVILAVLGIAGILIMD